MRLSAATQARLPAEVARFGYDRAAVRRGVVHLGLGAFHRAHQALVFEAALASGDLRWGITGVSLRSGDVRDRLAPQDGLYTVVVRDGDAEHVRLIGALHAVLVAPEDPAAVIAALAAPDTHIVTLTITEKGYGLDVARGTLRRDLPDVAHDLAMLEAPRTAAGFLVAALARRRAAGIAPPTIVSCDNLPENGARLRTAVLETARAHDADLAAWIAAEVAFPTTMVDRIVPAATEADVAALTARTGIEDRATVATEPFLQWVLEDRFSGPRPDFAVLGAQLTDDVAPWETAKLRMLNGAHSAIAYLGGLAGDAFVHDFVARPAGVALIEALWRETRETIEPPAGLDLAAYRAALMARFANPALRHRTRQIAVDGSQKLPQRLVAPLVERRARGLPAEALALAVAAWMRWQGGVDDAGERFVVDDPLAGITAAALAGARSAEDRVRALLAIEAIFPAALRDDDALVATLTRYLHRLETDGALRALVLTP